MGNSEAWIDAECPTPIQWQQTRRYILERTKRQDERIAFLEGNNAALASELALAHKENAQLRSDVRTLQAEAKRWRDECGTKRIGKWEAICPDEDGRYYEKIPEADATDTSGALTRWRDK